MTFWPERAASFGASARARMSVLPPGVKGTTSRIGRPWARSQVAGASAASAASALRRRQAPAVIRASAPAAS